MKQSFFESVLCNNRKHCEACRASQEFRKGITKTFEVDSIDFECPFGMEFEEKDFPTNLEMLKDFVSSGSKIVTDLLGRKHVLADDDIIETRSKICETCKLLEDGRCKKCGCVMKVKRTFKAMKCPLELW